jgi:hypothetical protein
MSDQLLHWLLGLILLAHGVAHLGAIGALWWVRAGHATNPGGWTTARTWLAPSLAAHTASGFAVAFWLPSTFGFVLAALAFLGIGLPVAAWPALGVVSAVISSAGILTFLGTWPPFNTAAALTVNVLVLVAVLAGWPPAAVLTA